MKTHTSILATPDKAKPASGLASGEDILERPAIAHNEVAQAVDESGIVCRTHVGGQALIEGVMMRGRYNWAVAVREPSGNIYCEEHDLISGRDKNSWMYKPVIRGCTALVESLTLGFQALQIAAEHAFDVEDDGDREGNSPVESQAETHLESHPTSQYCDPVDSWAGNELPKPQQQSKTEAQAKDQAETQTESALPKGIMSVSMVLGVLLGVGIFIVLPAVITNFLVGDYGEKTLLWNIIDGILRVAIFVFYIWMIGRMSDIKRMFAYHGAEHKTIHCYEHGLDLTVRNASRFPTLHVRCGTAFMIMTMIIAILVFTIVPVGWIIDQLGVQNDILRLLLVILSRIILLPVVAGLSYEFTVKWAGSRPEHPLVRVVLWPGLQMQKLTTNEPDSEMLECAIAAMKQVLRREDLEAARARDAQQADIAQT